MIEEQQDLPHVLRAFENWLAEGSLIRNDVSPTVSRWTFVTCGDWDLGVLLPSEAEYRKLLLPQYFKQWINLKKSFHKAKGYFARSLPAMLNDLKLTHQGRLHSGIDDVTNMCQILRELAADGHVFENTSRLCNGEINRYDENSLRCTRSVKQTRVSS